MLLKVSLVITVAFRLVSCMNFSHWIQNAREKFTNTVENVEKGASNLIKAIEEDSAQAWNFVKNETAVLVKTIEKEGAKDLNIVENGASNMVKIIEKEGAKDLNIIENGASNMVKIIEKEGDKALNIVEKGAADIVETAEDVIMLLKSVKVDSSCACANYTCGCCLQLVVEKIHLNETGCLSISYLPDEIGIKLMFTINLNVIVDQKMSVKNPPPLCVQNLYSRQLFNLCIRLYNLDYKEEQFSGCADVEVNLEGVVLEKYDFGCIHIPPTRRHFLI